MSKLEINSIVWCIFKGGLENTSYPESGLCNSKYLEYLCKNPIYEFDMGIIDEKAEDGFYVTLGSGIRIYLDTTNIIGDYYNVDELNDGQYFGRNTRHIKKYDKDKNKWQPFILLDDNLKTNIFSNYLTQLREYNKKIKKVYASLFFSYKISSLDALESFIYRLPLLPETCDKPSNEDEQKYKTNSVVLIRPTMGYRDFDYEFVVAIILEYVPGINKYIVSTFEYGVPMLIRENQIIKHIRCPDDRDYFGFFINRSKRFNSSTNMWEDVDEKRIENNKSELTKFASDKTEYVKLQNEQPRLTQIAMSKYLSKDGEVLSYLGNLAQESKDIVIDKGIETTGNIFSKLGFGRLSNAIDTAKTLFQPVKNLAYGIGRDLYNSGEKSNEKEQGKSKLNKNKGGSTIKRKTHRRKQMKKTSNKQSRNMVRNKSRKM